MEIAEIEIEKLMAIKKAAEEVVKMRHAGYPQFLGNALNDLERALNMGQEKVDVMARLINEIRKVPNATKIILGTEIACKLKRHEKFSHYAECSPTCIKLFGLVFTENSSFASNSIIIK